MTVPEFADAHDHAMAMNRWQFGVIAALLAALVWTQAFPMVFPKWAARNFEYRIESVPDPALMKTLDSWGSAGWDLVFARRAIDESQNGIYEVILKRPI